MSITRPCVVCLCGSTRFKAEFEAAEHRETLAGRIVVSPAVFSHAGDSITPEQKAALDELHLHKIDMADVVYVIDPGGYIGASTQTEITYAIQQNIPIRYLSEESPST